MFGTTPEGGKAELCVGVEKGFFEKTLLWVVELTDEWKVESRLPFLNEGYFEASIDNQLCLYRWGSEPKCTDCHDHASSEVPVRLGPVSRW